MQNLEKRRAFFLTFEPNAPCDHHGALTQSLLPGLPPPCSRAPPPPLLSSVGYSTPLLSALFGVCSDSDGTRGNSKFLNVDASRQYGKAKQ